MKKLLLVSLAVVGLSSCASTSHAPVGFGTTLPGLINVTDNAMVLGNSATDSKRGESCAHSVLGLFNWGDASVNTAKKRGGISEIAYVDGTNLSIIGIYAQYCSVVRGN